MNAKQTMKPIAPSGFLACSLLFGLGACASAPEATPPPPPEEPQAETPAAPAPTIRTSTGSWDTPS